MRATTIATMVLALAIGLGACSRPEDGRYPGDGIDEIRQGVIQNYGTPYDNSGLPGHTVQPVQAAFGSVGGQNWLVYIRLSDNHCTWYQVSTGTHLNGQQVSFSTSLGNDTIVVPGSGQSWNVWCSNYGQSWTVYQMQVTPNTGVTLYAQASYGNDTLDCSGAGFVTCDGSDGNDYIVSVGTSVTLLGDVGNDTIKSTVASSANTIRAGDGTDCVAVASPPLPAVYDCGGGTDNNVGFAGLFNCENLVGSCP